MKLVFVVSLLGIAVADKLNNIYLPPANSRTAGGSGSIILAPKYQLPSRLYGGPKLTYQSQQTYHSSRPIQITRFINENIGDGSYKFDYETENRITQHEVGQLRNSGTAQESSVVHGSYSFTAPDGQVYTVDYVADENGFQPTGSHLPTSPPIPDAILKSLQQNAAINNAESTYDDGQYREYQGNTLARNGGYRY